jgi:hypothetical protein
MLAASFMSALATAHAASYPPVRHTHGRQLKQFAFNDRIVGLLGKLPIVSRLVPQILRPIHAGQFP